MRAHSKPPPALHRPSATASWTVRKILQSPLTNRYPIPPNCFLGRFGFLTERDLDVDAGIDSRSMAKQNGGSLHFGTERHVWTLRYIASLRSEDAERTLRAGANFIGAARLVQVSKPDADGVLRLDADYAPSDPRALVTDAAAMEAIYLILLDILVMRTIRGTVERTFLVAVDRASEAVFGHVTQIDSVWRAAANPGSTIRGGGRAETRARGVAISDLQAKRDPVLRLYRDMMIVTHLRLTLARSTLVAEVAPNIARGWRFVLDQQRFHLRSPEVIPVIEVAITKIEKGGIGPLAELLLAVANSIDHPFADQWMEDLRSLIEPAQ